ncbi:hypothetical protein GGS21DRAFT_491401 [Xylaria nigripes]|nr:hypothetical protein GGS21DRAFT_491401 [Xylaria nigripes]
MVHSSGEWPVSLPDGRRFKDFKKLPTELQLQVWDEAFRRPQPPAVASIAEIYQQRQLYAQWKYYVCLVHAPWTHRITGQELEGIPSAREAVETRLRRNYRRERSGSSSHRAGSSSHSGRAADDPELFVDYAFELDPNERHRGSSRSSHVYVSAPASQPFIIYGYHDIFAYGRTFGFPYLEPMNPPDLIFQMSSVVVPLRQAYESLNSANQLFHLTNPSLDAVMIEFWGPLGKSSRRDDLRYCVLIDRYRPQDGPPQKPLVEVDAYATGFDPQTMMKMQAMHQILDDWDNRYEQLMRAGLWNRNVRPMEKWNRCFVRFADA